VSLSHFVKNIQVLFVQENGIGLTKTKPKRKLKKIKVFARKSAVDKKLFDKTDHFFVCYSEILVFVL